MKLSIKIYCSVKKLKPTKAISNQHINNKVFVDEEKPFDTQTHEITNKKNTAQTIDTYKPPCKAKTICVQTSSSLASSTRSNFSLAYLVLNFLTDPPVDFSSSVDVATTTWFESNSKRPHFKAQIVDDLLAHNSKHPMLLTTWIAVLSSQTLSCLF